MNAELIFNRKAANEYVGLASSDDFDFIAFIEFYRQLQLDSIPKLSQFYSAQVEFIDPAHKLAGLPALERYFSGLLAKTDSSQTWVTQSWRQDNTLILRWFMLIEHPQLNSGQSYRVDGMSQLTLQNGLIIYHRDFYDMGELLYQRLPLLGWVIAKLKQRLQQP